MYGSSSISCGQEFEYVVEVTGVDVRCVEVGAEWPLTTFLAQVNGGCFRHGVRLPFPLLPAMPPLLVDMVIDGSVEVLVID